ncbi:crocetin glucosyltransferase, chloroplastic-like [Cornus florida]|uniref:crocetin glucosyltransferase, chloroplastic-like n=1 Tax=Cornus florida TaxID=4283 RepID=UPI00289F2EBA|nr:crocetin glucosyltransferase, chloroplastic-like [Cornus florida]
MVDCHILLLTFPAQGAINPSIQLAKNLIRMGVKVTIITTLSAHSRMTKSNSTIPKGLSISAFSNGYDDGFKEGDNYEHFMSELRIRGSRAIAELIKASAEESYPITYLVYTTAQPWVAEVAHGHHIPSAVLWTQPATVFDIFHYYFNGYGDTNRKIVNDPSSSIQLPGLPLLNSRDLPSILVPPHSEKYRWAFLSMKEQLDLISTETNPKILVNTFDAIEPEALRAMKKHNLIPIGPLIAPSDASFNGDLFKKSHGYVEWLNSKPISSVVYVSFGSIAVLSKQQMEAIARGLLESHRPFMWVIRAKVNGEREEDKLSCLEELGQEGLIVPWCSQVEVLSHPSVGCFLTHCGWNSSLESLVSGVPVVGFPQLLDQMTNAKLLQDVWKMGLRVVANEEGIVDNKEISRCIEMVMGGGEREREMRGNAKKWKELAWEAMKDGGSLDMNLKAFVDALGDGH